MHKQAISRPASLGDQVADVVRRQIITQEIAAETLLVEAKLAEDFAVSRGPIREAIRTLTQEGLVRSAGRSASVVGLDANDIDEVFTLRCALETLAMRTAVSTNTMELAELQRHALGEMRAAVKAKDPVAFTHADLLFHDSFYTAAQHRRLLDVAEQYRPTIQNLLLVANLDHSDLAPSLQTHIHLHELIQTATPDEISVELSLHLDSSRIRVRGEYVGA